MPIIEGTARLKTAQADYDFAVDGGAVGTINMRTAAGDSHGAVLPAGSVITGGYIDVETSVASATGTVALTAEAAGDLLGATGQAGLAAGRRSIVPAGTGATAVKTTVARQLTMAIATAALTAGKFRLVVFYR
jgi:formylmethanofuran dehydrogenase subunit C